MISRLAKLKSLRAPMVTAVADPLAAVPETAAAHQ
jgi:hypothetical protein